MKKKIWIISGFSLACIILFLLFNIQTKQQAMQGFLKKHYTMNEQEIMAFNEFEKIWLDRVERDSKEELVQSFIDEANKAEEGYLVFIKKLKNYSTESLINQYYTNRSFSRFHNWGIKSIRLIDVELKALDEDCYEYYANIEVIDEEDEPLTYTAYGKVWLKKEGMSYYVDRYIEKEGFLSELNLKYN